MHRQRSPRGVTRGHRSGFNWGMPISQTFTPKQVRLRRTLIEKCRRCLPTIPPPLPAITDPCGCGLRPPAPADVPVATTSRGPRARGTHVAPKPMRSVPGICSDSTTSACPLRTHPPVAGPMLPPYRGRADGGRTHNIVPVGSGRPIGCHGPGRVGLVPDHEQRTRMCPLCFSTSSSLTITYVTG